MIIYILIEFIQHNRSYLNVETFIHPLIPLMSERIFKNECGL